MSIASTHRNDFGARLLQIAPGVDKACGDLGSFRKAEATFLEGEGAGRIIALTGLVSCRRRVSFGMFGRDSMTELNRPQSAQRYLKTTVCM